MKGIHLSILFLFFIVVIANSSSANSAIYKCIDELGRPIYSATPACLKPKEMDKISKKYHVKKKQEQERKEREEKKQREKQCLDAKNQLKKYQRAPFLTKMTKDEKGREVKVRLTKEETEEAILNAKKDVVYWCDDKSVERDK